MQTILEADPRHWQSGAIKSRLGDPATLTRLPFLRAVVQDLSMDLGTLARTGATYMRFTAKYVAADDLRLAYSKIMTEYEVTAEPSDSQSEAIACTFSICCLYPGGLMSTDCGATGRSRATAPHWHSFRGARPCRGPGQ